MIVLQSLAIAGHAYPATPRSVQSFETIIICSNGVLREIRVENGVSKNSLDKPDDIGHRDRKPLCPECLAFNAGVISRPFTDFHQVTAPHHRIQFHPFTGYIPGSHGLVFTHCLDPPLSA